MPDIAAVAAGLQRLQRLYSSRRVHAQLCASAGVALTQQSLRILVALVDGQTASELAAAAHLDGAAVSRELRRMETAGLVVREPSPHHHAGVLVRLTDGGRDVRDRVVHARYNHLGAAFSDWDPGDTVEFGLLLQRFLADLEATPFDTE